MTMPLIRRESKRYETKAKLINDLLKIIDMDAIPSCPCHFKQYDLVKILHCVTACPQPCENFINFEYTDKDYIKIAKIKILISGIHAIYYDPKIYKKRWLKYVKGRNRRSTSASKRYELYRSDT